MSCCSFDKKCCLLKFSGDGIGSGSIPLSLRHSDGLSEFGFTSKCSCGNHGRLSRFNAGFPANSGCCDTISPLIYTVYDRREYSPYLHSAGLLHSSVGFSSYSPFRHH